jgi:hypothetical protein
MGDLAAAPGGATSVSVSIVRCLRQPATQIKDSDHQGSQNPPISAQVDTNQAYQDRD